MIRQDKKGQQILTLFDCHLDPAAKIRELSIAERQIVELAKATVKKSKAGHYGRANCCDYSTGTGKAV